MVFECTVRGHGSLSRGMYGKLVIPSTSSYPFRKRCVFSWSSVAENGRRGAYSSKLIVAGDRSVLSISGPHWFSYESGSTKKDMR